MSCAKDGRNVWTNNCGETLAVTTRTDKQTEVEKRTRTERRGAVLSAEVLGTSYLRARVLVHAPQLKVQGNIIPSKRQRAITATALPGLSYSNSGSFIGKSNSASEHNNTQVLWYRCSHMSHKLRHTYAEELHWL